MQTARQKEILESALDLISTRGMQGLTIKNLAKSIGVTEPAIYRHYENKMMILVSILDLFKTNTYFIYEKELKGDFSAIQKIEHLFNRHFDSFSESPALVSVIFAEEIFRGEPSLTEKISEIIERNHSAISAIIAEGQANGEIRTDIDPKHLAILILGSLRLFVKKWQFSGYGFNINTEGKELLDSLKLMIIK
jgi:AcrR family transcriptional regulator